MKKFFLFFFAFLSAFTKFMFGQEKPNILFVYIDDMGYGDLKCYGSKVNDSPNLDKLASEGIRFTRYYAACPISSPSRVGMLTGQFPTRWGITSYIDDSKSNKERGMKNFLDLKAPSFARNLQAAGYYTAHIGKWHMGGGRDIGDVPYITEYGFNESVTQFEGIGERYLATYETLGDTTRNLERWSAALGRGDIHWIKREDFTKTYVNRAIKAIETAEAQKKPFYVNLWPDDVHVPLEPPRALRGDGSTKDHYYGVIKEMDNQFGRIFDYIRNNPKLRDNTIIIVASDNGPAPKVGSSGGLKGFKGNIYEGGIREPLIVWSPKYLSADKRGTVNSKTVLAGIDFAPSILKMTGTKPTKGVNYDGIDASKTLLGFEQPVRNKALMWQRPPGTSQKNPDLAIREGDYKLLIKIDGSEPELYNIAEDEKETTNLVDKYPDITNKLKKEVLSWYAEMPQPLVK